MHSLCLHVFVMSETLQSAHAAHSIIRGSHCIPAVGLVARSMTMDRTMQPHWVWA